MGLNFLKKQKVVRLHETEMRHVARVQRTNYVYLQSYGTAHGDAFLHKCCIIMCSPMQNRKEQ